MEYKIIRLFNGSEAELQAYIPDPDEARRHERLRPAMIVCPGGGYRLIAGIEGEPVALAWARAGYCSFVLKYSVGMENPFPRALTELAAAMKLIRQNAGTWMIDSENLSVNGFSAGGHLALSLGAFYKESFLWQELETAPEILRPRNLVLSYPSVTARARADIAAQLPRPRMSEILCGMPDPPSTEVEKMNVLNYISPSFPPCFIWGTQMDDILASADYLKLAAAVDEAGVDCEFHMFQNGGHAMSLGDETVRSPEEVENLSLKAWFDLALQWLAQQRVN